MSYDFINTTLTDATFSGSTRIGVGATIVSPTLTTPTLTTPTLTSPVITGATSISTYGTIFRQPGVPSASAATVAGITCAVTAVAAGVQALRISGSFDDTNTKLFFLNGLLVSASLQ